MEERKNRFIIFPDEEEEFVPQNLGQEKILEKQENNNISPVTIESFQKFDSTLDSVKVDSNESVSVSGNSPLQSENEGFVDFSKIVPFPIEGESGSSVSSLEEEKNSNSLQEEDTSVDQSDSSIENVSQDSDNLVENIPQNPDLKDLGDLGIIEKDEDGRIIFDTSLDSEMSSSLEESDSEGKEVDFSVSEESTEVVGPDVDNPEAPLSVDTFSNGDVPLDSEEIPQEIGSKEKAFQTNRNLQDMINKILKIDELKPVEVEITGRNQDLEQEQVRVEEERKRNELKEATFRQEIYDVVQEDTAPVVFKSDLLDKMQTYYEESGKTSMLVRYGEDYCSKDFVTNPAIGREEEIKQLILTLLTPEKSAILIGKPGIGKTSIVEGLAYRLQRNLVPEALQGFAIVNVKTPSLIGTLPNGETRLQSLVDELKTLDHVILFIDEIHMLIGATNDSAMDFANMFKEGLGRGQIKIIGATTTEEYERYILRDKAFVRRFQSIEVLEPSREHTIKILMGTLPKIEKETGAKMKYTTFIQSEIMAFITDITSEYKRVYGIGSRYPDICLTLLKESFSQCIFDNRDRVTIFDVRDAIQNSKNIYPDVIRKELPKFDEKFKKIIDEERADDASIDQL